MVWSVSFHISELSFVVMKKLKNLVVVKMKGYQSS